MLKGIQNFLTFLDQRRNTKRAQALEDERRNDTRKRTKEIADLRQRRDNLLIDIAGWEAEYNESNLYYIRKNEIGDRKRSPEIIEAEKYLKVKISKTQKEVEIIGARLDELTAIEDT